MAVTEEFRSNWLECQEEYGKNIEAGDIEVLALNRVDESVTLPAVQFSAPYNPTGDNAFRQYVHVPMATFKKPIDDLAQTVSTATQDLTQVKSDTIAATGNANTAAQNANTAATDAEKVNATLSGMTVTVTDRHGQARSVNIGFEIAPQNVYASKAAMIADAANVLAGKFCIIATTDATDPDNATLWSRNSQPASAGAGAFTFLSDLDQASSAAWADWLENMKPQITSAITTAGQDHTQAVSDHSTAASDHTRAGSDHTQAASDHTQAAADHTQAGSDHTTAQSDHTRAETDHGNASSDHSRAGTDHTTAAGDHTTAASDHSQAGSDHTQADTDHTQAASDHTRAGTDHTQAASDHTQAASDHTQAGNDHTASTTATGNANTQANRAKAWADHPPYIGNGTTGDENYWYLWNETSAAYQKGPYAKGDDLHWDDMSQEEKEALARMVLDELTFATDATCESIIDELT